MTGTIQALVDCQAQFCAEQTSWPLDMVRMLNGKPVCEDCYNEPMNELAVCVPAEDPSEDDDHPISWHDLPPVTMENLKR